MADFNEVAQRAEALGANAIQLDHYDGRTDWHCVLWRHGTKNGADRLMGGDGKDTLSALENAVEALEQGDRDARVASL